MLTWVRTEPGVSKSIQPSFFVNSNCSAVDNFLLYLFLGRPAPNPGIEAKTSFIVFGFDGSREGITEITLACSSFSVKNYIFQYFKL